MTSPYHQGHQDVRVVALLHAWPQASSAPDCPMFRACVPNPPAPLLGQAGPFCLHVPCQTLSYLLWICAHPMANSLKTSVTLLCAVCRAQDTQATTQAGQPSLSAIIVPWYAVLPGNTALAGLHAHDPWEGQDLALRVNSPSRLPLKAFSMSPVAFSCLSWLPLFSACKCSQCLQKQLCLEATEVCSALQKYTLYLSLHTPSRGLKTFYRNIVLKTGTMPKAPEWKEQKNCSEQTFWNCPSLVSWNILINHFLPAVWWFFTGLNSRGFEVGSKQHGVQCFISALVLALSSWTTQTRTRLVTPRQIPAGSCSELQADRQHQPRASLTSQSCPHCAKSKTKTLALIHKCLSETWSS